MIIWTTCFELTRGFVNLTNMTLIPHQQQHEISVIWAQEMYTILAADIHIFTIF